MSKQYTVAYRCHHVDHMDVTVDYATGLLALEAFEQAKTFHNIKFVRLECNGETADYWTPRHDYHPRLAD